MVKSTLPPLRSCTVCKSSKACAPPAYVTGSVAWAPKNSTSRPSIPPQCPSTSAACTKNSSQLFANWRKFSAFTAISVGVCQRFIATTQPSPWERQLKSSTKRSLPTSASNASKRSAKKCPSRSNNHEVTMTWLAPASNQLAAFSRLMPPPTCKPNGYAANAARAA